MIDLCTVGDLCWSVVLPVPHIPLGGEILQVQGSERLLGNDAAIVSLQAARLGLRCSLLATNAIATHDGLPLLELLQQEGVDTSQINTEGITTPAAYFLLRVNTDERVGLVETCPFHNPVDQVPASSFAYVDVYEEYIAERLSFIMGWSQANTRCYVNLSASNLIQKAQLLASIPSIDTLQMRGHGSIDDARALGRRVLQICRAKSAVVTLGDIGAVLIDQQDAYFIAAEPVRTLRTIGAGACFAAGFLYALAQGATHREAAIFANKQAAMFCSIEKNPLEVLRR